MHHGQLQWEGIFFEIGIALLVLVQMPRAKGKKHFAHDDQLKKKFHGLQVTPSSRPSLPLWGYQQRHLARLVPISAWQDVSAAALPEMGRVGRGPLLLGEPPPTVPILAVAGRPAERSCWFPHDRDGGLSSIW